MIFSFITIDLGNNFPENITKINANDGRSNYKSLIQKEGPLSKFSIIFLDGGNPCGFKDSSLLGDDIG